MSVRVNFCTENGDFPRRLDADFDRVAVDPGHFYSDLVSDYDALIDFSS